MKPFLLLSIRAEQAAADDELAAFARFLGVAADGLEGLSWTLFLRRFGPYNGDSFYVSEVAKQRYLPDEDSDEM